MEATELRIGNYLQYKSGEVFQIHSQDFSSLESIPEYLHPNPIPLTEEWLLKFGFKKLSAISFEKYINANKSFTIVYSMNAKRWSFPYHHKINTLVSFEYVHQLQNLYFALTGKELLLKSSDSQTTDKK